MGGRQRVDPQKGASRGRKIFRCRGYDPGRTAGELLYYQGVSETLAIRLLEGKFPPYIDLISRQEGHQIVMEKNLFVHMLKRMSILCTDNYRAAIFSFENGRLSINATNPDIGESKEDMAIDFEGDKIEAAFNPKFFIEAVTGVDDDKIVLNIVSENKPCLVDGTEDKSYSSAIMPMRV